MAWRNEEEVMSTSVTGKYIHPLRMRMGEKRAIGLDGRYFSRVGVVVIWGSVATGGGGRAEGGGNSLTWVKSNVGTFGVVVFK